MRSTFLFIVFLFSIVTSLHSTHISGTSIHYEYLGLGATPGTFRYKITVNLVRDCRGVPYNYGKLIGNEHIWARCSSSGALMGPIKLNWKPFVGSFRGRSNSNGAMDISDICRNRQTSCQTPSTSMVGYELFVLEQEIELSRCDSWEIGYVSDCCRNQVNNFRGGPLGALKVQINTNWSSKDSLGSPPANSGPIFSEKAKAMPTSCAGALVQHNVGVYDPDGDSLRFELTCPLADSNNRGLVPNPFDGFFPMISRSPYSCASPISNFMMDSVSGLISFRSSVTGKFIVAYCVSEYERCTGVLKGKTYREVQFNIDGSPNNLPKDVSGISNIVGNAVKTGPYELEVCEGQRISWVDTIYDPDVIDSLHLESNIGDVLEGGTYKVTPLQSNMAIVKFEWTAKLGIHGQLCSFFLEFDDNSCFNMGNGASIFTIRVLPAVRTNGDQVICQGDTAVLNAFGGKNYQWQSIGGDPIIKGVNWFEDSTSKLVSAIRFLPSQTTFLRVSVDSVVDNCGNSQAFSCSLVDTILIKVADSFRLSINPDQFLCNPASGLLKVVPSIPQLGYSYRWSPKTYLENGNIAAPKFKDVDKETRFTVRVISDSGCVRTSSSNVQVTPEPFPRFSVQSSDTLVCVSKRVELKVNNDEDVSNTCQASTKPCKGNYSTYTLGSGLDTNMVSAPHQYAKTFSGWSMGSRVQYLYRAVDLNALGMKAGQIQSIAWQIRRLLTFSDTISGFTIKVACTDSASLPNTFMKLKMQTVVAPRKLNLTLGWNEILFDSAYKWDGESNLLFEVCSENDSARPFMDQIQTFDRTNYSSSSAYYRLSTVGVPPCHDNPLLQPSLNFPHSSLPRTRFGICNGIRSTRVNYQWGPNSASYLGATNKDSTSLNAFPSSPKTLYVIVSDSLHPVCKDTVLFSVNVVQQYNTKPDSLPAQCMFDSTIQLSAPTPYNITSPGGKWTGQGIVNDSLGIWDATITGIGQFWVKYSVTGDVCSSEDSMMMTILGVPDVSSINLDSLCEFESSLSNKTELIPGIGGRFSGYGVDSTNNGTVLQYWLDGSKFNPSSSNPAYANVRYFRQYGCANDSVHQVKVIAKWDSTYLGVLYFGNPRLTDKFCMTGDWLDTLAVTGEKPIWRLLGSPSGIIDPNLGVLSGKLASKGIDEPFTDTLEVSNNGFCGTSNKFPVFFDRAPEVEVVSRVYCEEFLDDSIARNRVDSLWFKVPIGPLYGGTGRRTLGGANNDTLVKHYAHAGWGWKGGNGFWNAKPISNNGGFIWYVPAFQIRKKHDVTLTVSYAHSNHPRNDCNFVDTGYVFFSPVVNLGITQTGDLCTDSTMTLDAGQRQGAIYTWNDGATGQTRTIRAPGTYYAYLDWYGCLDTGKITISNCVSVNNSFDASVDIQLFPNPTSGRVNLLVEGIDNPQVDLVIHDAQGKLVYEEIQFDLSSGANSLDVSHLDRGVYFFKVVQEERQAVFRLVVE